MPVTLICRSCQNPFVVADYLREKAHYCSTTCHYEGKRKPTDPVVCAHCGQAFIVEFHRSGTARFCSKACHDDWRSAQHLAAFWDKVQQCAHGFDCVFCCWPWQGETRNIYRKVYVHNKPIGAHRCAWEIWNKRAMPAHLQAAHYCHFRACANPMHIHPATREENYADSIRDHRLPTGETHHNSKLTSTTAREAFTLKVSGLSNSAIARQLGVSKSTVTNLMAGLIWKDLPRPAILPKQKPPGRPKRNLL